MATTPEGRTKSAIRDVLRELGCWSYMPVPGGYGEPTLDYICARNGKIFCIEAKAKGKKATPRQQVTMRKMADHDVPSWVEDGTTIGELRLWILAISE